MSKNTNMHFAKRNKNDEFYTYREDIELELTHYKNHFKGKTVYLNCDDLSSAFYKYFYDNFEVLGLKKLIATKYNHTSTSVKIELQCGIETMSDMEGDGDFRSDEAIALLKESDIVVTNPPFSYFREYVAQLMSYHKKFLIIGNMNAITYKEIFPLIKRNKIWLGVNSVKTFYTRDGEVRKFGNIHWFTNLQHAKRNEKLKLTLIYDPEIHVKYDNYNIVNVNRVADIPMGYKGVMGVPITFLLKYNPDQFEILGSRRWDKDKIISKLYIGQKPSAHLDFKTSVYGKETYDRIFIRFRRRRWRLL